MHSGALMHLGRFGDDADLLRLPAIEPQFPGRPAGSLVAIPVALSSILCLRVGIHT